MENLLTHEDIRNLQQLNARLSKELSTFGISTDTVPEHLSQQLDEYVETQFCTGLSDMNAIKLREYYLTKKRQQLDQRLAISKLQIEVSDLKKQIEKETSECELLEKFVNKNSVVKEDYQPTKLLLKKKLQALQQKQGNFKIPEDINIEELIKKIDILKQCDAENKK